MFWIITIGLTLIATVLFAVALRRGGADSDAVSDFDIRVYRDQLKEIEKDVARGVIDGDEAERLRTEVSRRILAADATQERRGDLAASARSQGLMIGVTALVLIAGSFALYVGIGPITGLGAPGYGDLSLQNRIAQAEVLRLNRPSQATAEERAVPPATSEADGDYIALVRQLRDAVAQRPDDLEGHVLLVRAEARLGDFVAAHQTQQKVIALKGETITVDDLGRYANLLVLAADGYVSPETEAVVTEMLSVQPNHPLARYYYGLMLSQTGRPDLAFRMWDALLREGPAEAPWIAPILGQIEDLAARSGVRYQIPPIGAGRGPSQEDIDAAEDLTPTERIEMIRGMVSGLAERLSTEGGPPEDWAQLISSLGVLGRIDDARLVYQNALEVFSDDPTALDIVNRAADRAGLI